MAPPPPPPPPPPPLSMSTSVSLPAILVLDGGMAAVSVSECVALNTGVADAILLNDASGCISLNSG